MATTATEIQALYVAYFNRPADVLGLQFWLDRANASPNGADSVANEFSNSDEYRDLYANKTSAEIVDAIYMNLFGRHAEAAGLVYWALKLDKGELNIGNVARIISTSAQNEDLVAIDAKVSAAEQFTTSLTEASEILGYSGDAANAVAKTWLAGVKDADTLAAATTDAALQAVSDAAVAAHDGVVNTPLNLTLTTGIDNLVGKAGNDVITGSYATATVLGGLDVVDGGAGTDTLNIADSLTAANAAFTLGGMTVKNVEVMNIATNGGFTNLDLSGNAELTTLSLTAAGTAASTGIKIGNAVTASVNATAANIGVTGGTKVTAATTGAGTVTLTGDALASATVKAGTGAVSIVSDVLTTVSVTGGDLSAANSIDNGTKTTLTAVTLTNVDTNAAIRGSGITELTIGGATTAARTVTLTNATAGHSLTVNAAGTGYTAAGVAAQTVVTDAAATKLTINTTAKSSINASGSSLVSAVTLTGAGDLTLAPMGATVTSINGAAATGGLTLGSLNAAAVTVKTGAGNDSFTVNATTKVSVDAGAGNDTVTLGAALATESSVLLGAGNDKLLGTNAAAPAASAVSVIDGGDGTDTLSADLVNAGNAALFKNFESLSLNSSTGLDLALLSANTITNLGMDTASTTATYQNVAAKAIEVTYVGNNSGVTNTLGLTGVSGTADTFAINFTAVDTATPGSANVRAGIIATAGIENYTIASGGTKAWNEVTIGANTSAKTVVVTGDANLDLAFAATVGTAGSGGFSSIDGSTATGKLAINTTNLGIATAGLTVKTGAGADTITLAQKATVDAGAGDDIVTLAAAGGTVTGGAGADVINVAAVVAASTTAPTIANVTDFVAGTDKLGFDDQGTETFTATKVTVSTATALFGGTVNALDLAAAGDGSTNAAITWFQYAGDTYVVEDRSAAATLTATDIVVKLTGLVDLSGLVVADFNFV